MIQIGASDGISNDPVCYWIKRHKWRGILLEPLPSVFDELKKNYRNYSNVACVNAALDAHDGERTIFTVDMSGCSFPKAHQFSSFSRSSLLKQTSWVPDIADRILEQKVRCISFETLLQEHNVQNLDVLQIDAEGYDAEIIKLFPFHSICPSIVGFENTLLSKKDHTDALQLLLRFKYKISISKGETTAYIH